jgi:hypothetical protein
VGRTRHQGEGQGVSVHAPWRFGAELLGEAPRTGVQALALPFAKPTEYGLGRHGWVTVRLAKATKPLTEQCMAWIDESFRAVAPKRVVAGLPPVS